MLFVIKLSFVQPGHFCCLNERKFLNIIFGEKFKMGLSVHCPPPHKLLFISGEEVKHKLLSWKHIQHKSSTVDIIFNQKFLIGGGVVQWNVPKRVKILTFLYRLSDVKLSTHGFSDVKTRTCTYGFWQLKKKICTTYTDYIHMGIPVDVRLSVHTCNHHL